MNTANKMLAGGLLALLILVLAVDVFAQVCYDENNDEIKVPQNYKLVAVPWWWPTEEIIFPMKGAKPVIVPKPDPCDDLVVSPGECDE
jgi:hypothetical protein